MDDRREFERFKINVPVKIHIPDQKEEQGAMALETDNLSAGGIFFKSAKVLPEGREVKMEITFHFDELKSAENPAGALVIAVTGSVQRTGTTGMAICFHEDYDVSHPLDFLEKHQGVPINT